MKAQPIFINFYYQSAVQRAQCLLVSVKAQPTNNKLCSKALGLYKGEAPHQNTTPNPHYT